MRPLRARLLFTLAATLAAAQPALAAPSIFGHWFTDDRSAVVRVDRCGAKLCGAIERVLNPKAPLHDINNPEPSQRAHPLVGTAVLTGFTGAGANWDGGQAYDPKVGRSYRSRLTLLDERRLRVTGCVFFLCKSLIWTRAGD